MSGNSKQDKGIDKAINGIMNPSPKGLDQAVLKPVHPPQAAQFPTDAFPSPLQKIITELQAAKDYPPAYVGTAMLYAASVAIGNSRLIETNHGRTPCNLFCAIVGYPGVGKTPALDWVLGPLREVDNEITRKYKEEKAAYNQLSEEEKKEKPEPTQNNMLKGDITPEALATKLEARPKGLGLFYDELAGWVKEFGRYNQSGDEQRWNSLWSATTYQVDRKVSESSYVEHPFVSVCGGLQPSVLERFAAQGRSDNGFLDRFLFAYAYKPKKTRDRNLREPSHDIGRVWSETITPLAELEPWDWSQSWAFTLGWEPDAYEAYLEFQDRNADAYDNTDSVAEMLIRSKYESYMMRLALIIELLSSKVEPDAPLHAYNAGESIGTVSLESARGAIALCDYYIEQALKVREIISNPAAAMPENDKAFFEALPDYFATKEAKKLGTDEKTGYGFTERTVTRKLKKWVKDGLLKKAGQGQYEKIA